MCHGHGTCSGNVRKCDSLWTSSPDCILFPKYVSVIVFPTFFSIHSYAESCPEGRAWVDKPYVENKAHHYAQCSNQGLCDLDTVRTTWLFVDLYFYDFLFIYSANVNAFQGSKVLHAKEVWAYFNYASKAILPIFWRHTGVTFCAIICNVSVR